MSGIRTLRCDGECFDSADWSALAAECGEDWGTDGRTDSEE
jgi:hypothetical protein